MWSNFEFLDIYWSGLAELGKKAEKQLYYDNNACIVTIGTFAERMTEEILNSEHLQSRQELNQFNKIEYLKLHKIISLWVVDLLHQIRMLRNKVGHGRENASEKEALMALQQAYYLSVWFVKNYSSKAVSVEEFRTPVKQENTYNRNINYQEMPKYPNTHFQEMSKYRDVPYQKTKNDETEKELGAKTIALVIVSIIAMCSILLNIALLNLLI